MNQLAVPRSFNNFYRSPYSKKHLADFSKIGLSTFPGFDCNSKTNYESYYPSSEFSDLNTISYNSYDEVTSDEIDSIKENHDKYYMESDEEDDIHVDLSKDYKKDMSQNMVEGEFNSEDKYDSSEGDLICDHPSCRDDSDPIKDKKSGDPIPEGIKYEFVCNEPSCGKGFSSHRGLQVHKGKQKHYSKIGCGRRFSNKMGLLSHMKVHKGDHPSCRDNSIKDEKSGDPNPEGIKYEFVCNEPNCQRGFLSHQGLQVHKRKHYAICNKIGCGRRFSNKMGLLSHMRVHKGDHPSCRDDRDDDPIKDEKSGDPNPEGIKYEFSCNEPNCQRGFLSHRGLQVHKKRKHYVICSKVGCGKRFSNKMGLLSHTRVHKVRNQICNAERPHKCNWPSCGGKFTKRYTLKMHMRIHTREKPFECDWSGCGKRFSQVYNLKCHGRTHTGERPYKCNWKRCGMKFSQKHTLKVHTRIHTGERPYKCDLPGCEKAFARSYSLRCHTRIHTGEKPYKCNWAHCEKKFTHLYCLKIHKRTHWKKTIQL